MPHRIETPPSSGARHWVPWFIFLVALTVSLLSAVYVSVSNRSHEKARFYALVNDGRDDIDDALQRYITALRGVSGLFAALGQVNGSQFHAYFSETDIQQRYPGMRLIGYLPHVLGGQVGDFVNRTRAEGLVGYTITPAGARSDYFPVRFEEPLNAQTQRRMGYDMATVPERNAALRRAGDIGSPAMTNRLKLFAATADAQPVLGFVIFLPLYPSGITPTTVEQRREKLTGVVYAVFRADDFFRNIIGSDVRDRVRMEVYDGVNVSADSLLHDSTSQNADKSGYRPRFTEMRTVQVAGNTWTIRASERPTFDLESGERLSPMILLGGMGISLVLFAVTRGLAAAQERSQRTADELLVASTALRTSQARLRRLVDSNLIGVFFCDIGGNITDGNDEFYRLVGLARGAAVRSAMTLQSITPADWHEADAQAVQTLLASGVGPAYEKEFVRPDGQRVPVLIGMALVEGSARDAVGFALDLTERKRGERDLRAAKEAAESANRSKDQFLAVLSHELRTPLTPVLAAATMWKNDSRLPADLRDEMSMIHRNVELEARLIDDLLDLTRIGRGKLQLQLKTVDLHEMIRNAASVCSAEELAAKNLKIEQKLEATHHYVLGDPARLQQIFWNLLKNAVKFTPRGGRIVVDTCQEGDAIVAEVRDNGIGIEPEVLPKIFDAFEQGSVARAQASGGLGLGLAISRGLVLGHGGSITARSLGRDVGAVFTVKLQTIPTPVVAKKVAPADDGRATTALNILLVEDHVDTARVMGKLLMMCGHRVTTAQNVAEGLRASETAAFDILISDLGLPDGSGFDVIRGVRQQPANENIKAIALTGYGADDDIRKTADAGFADHLIKPVNFETLRLAIERVAAGEFVQSGDR